MRSVVVLAAGLTTLGTHCMTARLSVQQSLRPVPSSECIDSAVARSADVVRIIRHGSHMDGFTPLVRDSAATGGQRAVAIIHPTWPDTVLSLDVTWFGLRNPSVSDQRAAAVVASRLLKRVRAACAPGDTGRASCHYDDFREVQSCSLVAPP